MKCSCFQIFFDVLKKGLALRPTKNRCLAATVKIIGKVYFKIKIKFNNFKSSYSPAKKSPL